MNPLDDARLRELLDAACSDTISPEQVAQLEALLTADPAARRVYDEFMQLNFELHFLARVQRVEASKPSSLPLRARFARFISRPMSLSMTVAALVVGVLVTAMYFMVPPFYRALALRGPQQEPPSYEVVARLTGVHEAVWEVGQVGTQLGAHLVMGHRMELKSGLAEVTYDSGARVTLQGPAVFIVSGGNAATLHEGQLAALVTPESHGFVVDTPPARLVDLGTEFGVVLDEGNNLEVHVFQGEVALEAGEREFQRQVLGAGQAVVVRAAGGGSFDKLADRSKFVRRLPTLENEYAPATAYSQHVLSYRPVLYYRMEPLRAAVLFDSGPLARHGVLRTSVTSETPFDEGIDGKSLLLGGPAVGDSGLVAPYPSAKDKLSVVAWVYAKEHSRWGNIAANWGDLRTGQFHFGQYGLDGDLCVHVTQNNGALQLIREGHSHPLPLESWQHVAFVVDGENLRLYRNGEEVAAAACQGLTARPSVSTLAIGCKTNDQGVALSTGQPALWHGRIDELAVFHRALAAETIRDLAQRPVRDESKPNNLIN